MNSRMGAARVLMANTDEGTGEVFTAVLNSLPQII